MVSPINNGRIRQWTASPQPGSCYYKKLSQLYEEFCQDAAFFICDGGFHRPERWSPGRPFLKRKKSWGHSENGFAVKFNYSLFYNNFRSLLIFAGKMPKFVARRRKAPGVVLPYTIISFVILLTASASQVLCGESIQN